MALYPVPAPGYNGINQNLFPFKVASDVFKEWVQITPLFNLMGNEPTRPIVRKKLGQREGLQYRMGKLQALDYKNPVVNFDQRRGNAQQQRVDYDSVNVDFFCTTLQDMIGTFTAIQSLYSPGKSYRSVEYINAKTNVHKKAIWNPEFSTFGSKEFRTLHDSLMQKVPASK